MARTSIRPVEADALRRWKSGVRRTQRCCFSYLCRPGVRSSRRLVPTSYLLALMLGGSLCFRLRGPASKQTWVLDDAPLLLLWEWVMMNQNLVLIRLCPSRGVCACVGYVCLPSRGLNSTIVVTGNGGGCGVFQPLCYKNRSFRGWNMRRDVATEELNQPCQFAAPCSPCATALGRGRKYEECLSCKHTTLARKLFAFQISAYSTSFSTAATPAGTAAAVMTVYDLVYPSNCFLLSKLVGLPGKRRL